MGYNSKIYANMLVSLESAKLIDEEKLRRIADASPFDALKILADYGWSDAEDIETLISKETANLLEFINEYCADETVKAMLLTPFIFNNAKAAYKNRLTGSETPEAYYNGVNITDGAASGDYSALPAEMGAALTKLDESMEAQIDQSKKLPPKIIDEALTTAMYAFLKRISKTKKTLAGYTSAQIDMLNIMTFIRAQLLGIDIRSAAESLITGGKIDADALTEAAADGSEALGGFIGDSAYAEVFAGFEDGAQAIADIETRMDNQLYSLTAKGAGGFLGNAPLINYFYKKLAELKTVKMVVLLSAGGKKGEISRRTRIFDE